MLKSSINFYKDLDTFSHTQDILNENNYKKLPEDRYIIVTDIKNSTKAIESGQYKDVNVIGVSSIIAANNSCNGPDIPYIFGGDGAMIFAKMKLSNTALRPGRKAVKGDEVCCNI